MGISLPKIEIGKAIGGYVSEHITGGTAIVGAVNTGIKIVKDTKLSLPQILKDSGQAAIDAAAARVNEGINQAAYTEAKSQVQNAAIPILLGVGILFLLWRGRR